MPVDHIDIFRKHGWIGLVAVVVIWFLFAPTISTPGDPAMSHRTKSVNSKRTSARFDSMEEAQRAIQTNQDQQMVETRRMTQSITGR